MGLQRLRSGAKKEHMGVNSKEGQRNAVMHGW